MALIVKNNMDSVNALKNLSKNNEAMNKDLKKLASGEKITGAGDGASEYAISERMRVQVKSLDQDDRNAQNGISILNVASGAIESTINILRTMKEKAIDAANDSNSDADRAMIQKVIDQSIDQINENAMVSYNGISMLDGSRNGAVVEGGTYTHLTTQGLATDTTVDTAFVDLMDRGNNALGIQKDDTVTVSWVKDGVTKSVSISPLYYTQDGEPEIIIKPSGEIEINIPQETHMHTLKSFFAMNSTISGDMELIDGSDKGYNYVGTDEAGDDVYTIDNENGITVKAKEAGVSGQLAGLTVSVRDSQGNERTSVNAALDTFTETIRGQNQSDDNAMVFQIGTKANQSLKAGFTDMRASALGLEALSVSSSDSTGITTVVDNGVTVTTTVLGNTKLNVGSQAAANAAINVIDNALQKALDQQTKIGAETSRLEYTSANLVMSSENVQAAESVIRDADMAREQTAYARDSILTQAAQAMLAQSNQNGSSVLSLLQ